MSKLTISRLRLPILLAVLAALTLVFVAVLFLRRSSKPQIQANILQASGLVGSSTAGYTRADKPKLFSFPADYGPHPDYQTEWWYYTGNLNTTSGQHFGYQLTFFRRALLPPDQRQRRSSDLGADQIFLAHFALTDVSRKRYQAYERFSRGAAGLAGAQSTPYQVWLENWSVAESSPGQYQLQASQDQLSIDLELADLKGPIPQGDQGYSQKGPEPGNASYYYSLTRLKTSGVVQIGAERFQVDGLSWMDHEYSTSALSSGQTGWDWFSMQFNDGSELMVFQIRRKDGTVDHFSSGTFVLPDGSTRHLNRDDFIIQVENTWTSPHSKAMYPSRWTVQVPAIGLTLHISPYLDDQELNVSYNYWEGAVQIEGQRSGKLIAGSGYVELTGYTRSMTGEF